MRFIDEAKIRIAAGHGGPGCVSFRRETFIPRGGPDGGDGGRGGNIVFKASNQLSTLQDFRFKRVYQAENGHHGSGANKTGRDGEDIFIRVPVGTLIKETESQEVLIDFSENNQEWIACKGGRGGKGNAHFVSSTHQAPKFAQPGEDGESREISLELKLLADVGIIGFPNAGKSTLISKISAAKPKIADYPFTTLVPNLGVVSMPDLSSFVVADVPGLIEGAHRGLGLGHKFLKHIERTRLFIHLLDGAGILEDATDPADTEAAFDTLAQRYVAIRTELGLFDEKLLRKPEMVVINKFDLMESDPELMERARQALKQRIAAVRVGVYAEPPNPKEPWVVSAVSGSGIRELLLSVQENLKSLEDALRVNEATLLPDDRGMRNCND